MLKIPCITNPILLNIPYINNLAVGLLLNMERSGSYEYCDSTKIPRMFLRFPLMFLYFPRNISENHDNLDKSCFCSATFSGSFGGGFFGVFETI